MQRATSHPLSDDSADDFDDVTIPEQPRFVPREVTFDPTPMLACESALRASRRRARLRRVKARMVGGAETVLARPRRRRATPRRFQLAASVSILVTAFAAVVAAGVLV